MASLIRILLPLLLFYRRKRLQFHSWNLDRNIKSGKVARGRTQPK